MKSSLFRAVGALALLACFLFPPSARSEISTPPGSAERIAKMEAELKTLQEEAAKDPSRPTLAELQRDVEQMVAAKNATASRRDEAVRLKWLTRLSFGLNVALALALLGRILVRRRGAPQGGRGIANA